MRKGAGIWAWVGENSGALLVAGAVLGGFWAAGGSLATNEDVERATRDLATKGDLAGLATRADLDTTERTVNTLRETVASLGQYGQWPEQCGRYGEQDHRDAPRERRANE